MPLQPDSPVPAGAPRLMLAAACALGGCAVDAIETCESHEGMQVICGVQNPEDLAPLPGERFVIVSQFGSLQKAQPGALGLLDGHTRRLWPLFPQAGIGGRPAIYEGPDWGDASCPGPPGADFSPHGIDLVERGDGRWQLDVVNHGGRESIEMFEVMAEGDSYVVQWRGCAPAPGEAFFNDVVAMPDGGLFVTHMYPRSDGLVATYHLARAALGAATGRVLRWSPADGFEPVPGSEGAMPNGIEADPHGETLYVNLYMDNRLRRIRPDDGERLGEVEISHPDNVTWGDDGRLWVASHRSLREIAGCLRIELGACPAAFDIVAVDPQRLTRETIFSHQGPPMGAATVAVPLLNRLLLGSFHSDRMLLAPR